MNVAVMAAGSAFRATNEVNERFGKEEHIVAVPVNDLGCLPSLSLSA
jgi:hypothetical protein